MILNPISFIFHVTRLIDGATIAPYLGYVWTDSLQVLPTNNNLLKTYLLVIILIQYISF